MTLRYRKFNSVRHAYGVDLLVSWVMRVTRVPIELRRPHNFLEAGSDAGPQSGGQPVKY